jgi:UDP-N-acetylglucosamine:LPS N-acetylglucosamine transferase
MMLMEEIGGGHKMPALAVRDSMAAIDPSLADIPVVDLSKESGAHVDGAELKEYWNWLLEHPEVTRFGNLLMNALPEASRLLFKLKYMDYYERGVSFLHERKPGLVFSSYYLSSIIAAEARERFGLGYKLITQGTDPFDANVIWLDKRIDWLILCSYEARRVAIRRGFPAEKIKVFPFPINNKFFDLRRGREEIKRELELPEGKLTLLATAGGMARGILTE